MYQTGLVLGKFAPFHRGHQTLIDAALREVRQLIVVVYRAERTTSLPLVARARWIRSLYPETEVIEATDGPEDTGYTPEIMKAQEDFLLSLLAGRKIDAFYSGERYGEHVSKALGCVNRSVDPGRTLVPISATMIRSDPDAHRDFLDPLVRADLVPRVVLLGAPSTGKTSLARALAEGAGEPWCPEYGRAYWFEHQVDHRLSMVDLEVIACEQARLERRFACEARRFLAADTCPLTTLVYARYYHGSVSPALEGALESYLVLPRSYWLCDADFPFEDSEDRSGSASREVIQSLTIEELERRGICWRLASGTVPERVSAIASSLAPGRGLRIA